LCLNVFVRCRVSQVAECRVQIVNVE
jgi:hypothetical protein